MTPFFRADFLHIIYFLRVHVERHLHMKLDACVTVDYFLGLISMEASGVAWVIGAPGRTAILPPQKVVRRLMPPYHRHFCRPF